MKGPSGVKIGPQRPLGPILEPPQLFEASSNALGGLLGRSWRPPEPKKSALERLLAGPRAIPREVSAILEAKWLPKRTPGGSQMELKKHLERKVPKSQNL